MSTWASRWKDGGTWKLKLKIQNTERWKDQETKSPKQIQNIKVQAITQRNPFRIQLFRNPTGKATARRASSRKTFSYQELEGHG